MGDLNSGCFIGSIKRCQPIELQVFGISSSLLKFKNKIIDINIDYDGQYGKIQIITKTTKISNSNNNYEGDVFTK